MSKADIKDLLKSIKKYFKVAPKHLNNMYALDENQYQLINEYIEELETESNILENKLNQLNTYILINGIDDTLKTATQISVENQRYYLHQKEVERLKKIIEQLNTTRKEIIWELLKDKEKLVEELKYNATKRETVIQLKLIDKYLKIKIGRAHV